MSSGEVTQRVQPEQPLACRVEGQGPGLVLLHAGAGHWLQYEGPDAVHRPLIDSFKGGANGRGEHA